MLRRLPGLGAAAAARSTSPLFLLSARRCFADDASTAAGAAGAAGTATPSSLTDLEAKLKQLETEKDALAKQLKDSKQDYLYALAETENVRKIAARDVETARQFALTRFSKALLEVSDTLERATAALSDEHADPIVVTLIQGVKATEKNLLKAFGENGIKPYGAPGEPMDPHRYEAVYVQDTDEAAKHNTVSVVMRKGYTLNQRVLRPAQVGVFKKTSSS